MVKCLECNRGYKSEETGWVLCPTCFVKVFEQNLEERRQQNGEHQYRQQLGAAGSGYAGRCNDEYGARHLRLPEDQAQRTQGLNPAWSNN